MGYKISNEQALLLEEAYFKYNRLPLFILKYKKKYGKINKSREMFLNEISWYFNLCKIIIDWKGYYSKEIKEEKKNEFIIKIAKEYSISEFKAKEKYTELDNIFNEVYKELVSGISIWNVLKGVFIGVFLLSFFPVIIFIYFAYGNKIYHTVMKYLVNIFNI